MDTTEAKSSNLSSTNGVGDDTDIFPFRETNYSRRNRHVAPQVVGKDDYFYKMNHSQRGIAMIFNHEKFNMSYLKDRSGTQADCDNLKATWERIGFKVTVHQDLGTKALTDELEALSKVDFSNMDCLVICVLSHGEEGVIYSKDSAYKHEMLWERFTADKCPSLAGKPKLYFIQACQGRKLDPGVSLLPEVDGNARAGPYKIPIHADFLFAYSTIPGFYSWRNTTRGSWFIQGLCSELHENAFLYDILTLLTFVNRRVAVDFESNVPNDTVMHNQKQISCITSMLTRLLKFPEKLL